MNLRKRLAALAAALVFAVMLLPTAAFAETTPAPVTDTLTIDKDSYSITGGNPTIARYTMGLQLTVKFKATVEATSTTQKIQYNAAISGGNFAQTSVSPDNTFSVDFAAKKGNESTVSTEGSFLLKDIKYFGAGNTLTITIYKGTTNVGNETLTIGECQVEPTPTPTQSAEPTPSPEPSVAPTATPTPDPRAPGLIIKSSSISENSVGAGDDFKLNLTVYATSSGTEDVLDVLVSIAPGEGVMVASGSSTQYIGTMKPGSAQTVSFPMKAQADFTKGVSTVAVTLSGTGATAGTAANATGTTISVPINQPDRFQISKVEVPESIMVGEEQMATITFVNMGKNPVSNLTLDFACDNCQEAAQSQYVGNLAAGTEDSVDFDLLPLQAGELSGTITVSYEGANGETVTQTQNISATVEESMMPDDSEMISDDGEMPADGPAASPLPWWGMLLIVGGIVAAIVVVIVYVRRRKAKKQQALEAEDEDI